MFRDQPLRRGETPRILEQPSQRLLVHDREPHLHPRVLQVVIGDEERLRVGVTTDPTAIQPRDVENLRALGWTDPEILTSVQVIGFFNYYVRMVEALGVEPESEMKKDPAVWPDP